MQFEELGASLQLLRQSKGLQLDDIARNIKLSERTLTSIEAGRVDDLPHAVYAKGFVRTYAKYLGMPEEELNAALQAAFPVDENEVNAPPVALFKPQRKSNKLGTFVLLIFLHFYYNIYILPLLLLSFLPRFLFFPFHFYNYFL